MKILLGKCRAGACTSSSRPLHGSNSRSLRCFAGSEDEGSRRPSLDVQDPSQTVVWGGRLPSTRRAVTGGLTALGIVLISDFGGATRTLLGVDGGRLAAQLHLDVIYPVKGFKRCLDAQNGFEFQYPADWLADQRMFRRNAERREQQLGLDPPSARRQSRTVAEPVAAFGPPGSTGELNVSVIVAPIRDDFQLSSLGGAGDAATRFLETTVAPPGSGLETRLYDTREREDANGRLHYELEFSVERPGKFFRHNVSSYVVRGGTLFTLNAQCPEADWKRYQTLLQQTAASFVVTSAGKLPAGL